MGECKGSALPDSKKSAENSTVQRVGGMGRPSRRGSTSPSVVHSPLREAASRTAALMAPDMQSPEAMDAEQQALATRPSARRRAKSPSLRVPTSSRSLPKTTSPTREVEAAGAASSSRCALCVSRTLTVVLLGALLLLGGACSVLFLALLSTSMGGPLFEGLTELSVSPPCAPPPYQPPQEPMLALPEPPYCRFSLLRLRCSPQLYCQTRFRWLPVPHAKCTMRPEFS